MKTRFLIPAAVLVGALFAASASRATSTLPTNSYSAVDLNGYFHGMNDSGDLVGEAYWADVFQATLVRNGEAIYLGTLGGWQSAANAINASGQVVGWANLPEDTTAHAFLWDETNGMVDLGALGDGTSWASAINDAGQVVGTARTAGELNRAVLWQNGQMYALGVPDGYVHSSANSINAAGEIAGTASDATETVVRAVLWRPTVPNGTDFTLLLPSPNTNSAAYGINSAGDVAGMALGSPTLWDAGGSHPLPLLSATTGGVGLKVNASRTVVGWCDGVYTGQLAFVWDGLRGTRDLSALSGRNALPYPYAINAAGEILVRANDGLSSLLIPSPLPSRPLHLGANGGPAGVVLSWTPGSGAVTHTVKRSAAAGGPYTPIASVMGTTYTDTNVVLGSTYYYVVTAVNEYGQSADSAEARSVQPPAPPTHLTAAAGKRKVTLQWRQSPGGGVVQNRIYRSTTGGSQYSLHAAVSGTTSYTDTKVTSRVTYYYVVTAVDARSLESTYSNQASASPR